MTEKDIARALQANLDRVHLNARTRAAVLGAADERKVRKKLSFGVALAIMLVLAAAAAAAVLHWDALEKLVGGNMRNADEVMQSNLHQETVNHVEITIKEAGYDGKTLWLATSYRMLDVDTVFGAQGNGVSAELDEALRKHKVGWWMDAMWINGQDTNTPGNSYSTMDGSDVPGEVITYEAWRLDNENVYLSGRTEIALPIGDRQSVTDYARREHPERYNKDGKLMKPDKGMIVFSFTPDPAGSVTEQPCIKTNLPEATAQVSEVVYSPIMTYITLDIEMKPGSEGASVDDWAKSLTLVDGEGKEVFAESWRMGLYYTCGWNGYGEDSAEYLFPYRDNWPDELYLAPMNGDEADMSLAVKVK